VSVCQRRVAYTAIRSGSRCGGPTVSIQMSAYHTELLVRTMDWCYYPDSTLELNLHSLHNMDVLSYEMFECGNKYCVNKLYCWPTDIL